ncbi:MAG TPA: DUF3822 family protein, partial [Chitinophagaceae bacterium]|nr:DUF3822 family protein [Chitinophagaceae bacterium]
LILTGNSQFKYAVMDPPGNKFIALKTYQGSQNGQSDLELVESCFDADKLLYTAFRQIRIGFASHRNVLIPSSLYSVTEKREPLKLLYGEGTHETVLCDELPELGLMNVYAVNRNILGFLKKEFPPALICHAATPLLRLGQGLSRSEPDAVFLLVQPHWFGVMVFSGEKLLLQQQTRFSQTIDLAYHVLNILDKLGISPETTALFLGGDSAENASVFETISPYIPNARWLDRLEGYQFSEKFSSYPSSYFFDLFAVALCGS